MSTFLGQIDLADVNETDQNRVRRPLIYGTRIQFAASTLDLTLQPLSGA